MYSALLGGEGAKSRQGAKSSREWPLHMAVVKCWFHFRTGFVTAISLLKPPCGGYRSETATWIQKYFKKSVGASRKL
jgi:hypothetical protein